MRFVSHIRQTSATVSIDSCRSANGFVRKPCSRSHSRVSHWLSSWTPSPAPSVYIQTASGRDAVIEESFWRSEPAAAFLGFGASFWPSSATRSFSSRNPEIGM